MSRPASSSIVSQARFAAAGRVGSIERLWKKPVERLMVGRIPNWRAFLASLSQVSFEIAQGGGAKNKSSKDSTEFLHNLASCWAAKIGDWEDRRGHLDRKRV